MRSLCTECYTHLGAAASKPAHRFMQRTFRGAVVTVADPDRLQRTHYFCSGCNARWVHETGIGGLGWTRV